MKNSNGNLAMTKGDSESFLVGALDDSGAVVSFVTGDTVYFTVRGYPSDDDIIFQKVITSFTEDDEALVEILSTDTSGLDMGDSNYIRLWYDVQLTKQDGTVKTIVKPHQFLLLWEVTTD